VPTTRVYFEEGKTSVFAAAIDWPGWCRRAKTMDAALETLVDYQDRYARIVSMPFKPGKLDVVGTVPGNATTDFGAPGVDSPWDAEPLTGRDLKRQVQVLVDSWNYFDAVVASAPPQLAKGPRGGGRDRDDVVAHVREAERHYCSKLGTRVLPRTPWAQQRATINDALLAGSPDAVWPSRYSVRRLAWHVVDHAWEIEDKSG
jgi:lambda repressor-like predicted transcriptional regulator